MADNSLEDQIRQRAHSDMLRARREESRMTPQEREERDSAAQQEAVAKMIAAAVDRAVAKAIKGIVIQSGNAIRVSGNAPNFTIAWEPPAPVNQQQQAAAAGSALPDGAAGDILYHDGAEWVLLAAPTIVTNNPVLRHNGTAPYWEEPASC